MTPARFYFDGMDPADGWIGTFDPREDWNGYAIPHFAPDVWADLRPFIEAEIDDPAFPLDSCLSKDPDGRIVVTGLCFYADPL